MQTLDEQVFLYHAHAYALGGKISQPVAQDLNSHAATSLSIVGGYSTATSGPFNLDKLVSYDSAHTYISGIQNDSDTCSTVCDTVIEGLNILDVITADSITGRLSSKHKKGQPAEILTLGSGFQNLVVAGVPVDVQMDNDLITIHPTHEALMAHYEGKCAPDAPCAGFQRPAKVRHTWGLPAGDIPQALKARAYAPLETGWVQSRGSLHSSIVRLVDDSRCPCPPYDKKLAIVPYGSSISIPDVGTLYLGDLSTDSDTKRLTMLRLELGCPVTGRVAAGGPQTNGKWLP